MATARPWIRLGDGPEIELDGDEAGVAEAIRALDGAAIRGVPLSVRLRAPLRIGEDLAATLAALPEWGVDPPGASSAEGSGFDPGDHLALGAIRTTRALVRAATEAERVALTLELLRVLVWTKAIDDAIALATPWVGRATDAPGYPEMMVLLASALSRRPLRRAQAEVADALSGRPEARYVELLMRQRANAPAAEIRAWMDRVAPEVTVDGRASWWGWHQIGGSVCWSLGDMQATLDHAARIDATTPYARFCAALLRVEVAGPRGDAGVLDDLFALAAALGRREYGAVCWAARSLGCAGAPQLACLERAASLHPQQRLNLASALFLADRPADARRALHRAPGQSEHAHGPGGALVSLALGEAAGESWERSFALAGGARSEPRTALALYTRIADGLPASPTDSRRARALDRARAAAERAGAPDDAAALAARLRAEPSATPLGAFDLLEPLGAGAMGRVHHARHRLTGRSVALKVLTDARARHPEARAWFQREIQVQAGLVHPGLVAVLDCGEVDGLAAAIDPSLAPGAPWLAMERVDGTTLATWCGQVDAEATQRIALALLDALAHCHARGVTHCDLKPANVLVAAGRPKLADFGLARLGPAGVRGGTPTSMAPEQFDGVVTPQSDLYALGCLVVELLQGFPAWIGDLDRLRRAHRSAPRPRLEASLGLAAGWDDWLASMLAPDPDDRPPSAAHAAEALARLGSAGAERHRGVSPRISGTTWVLDAEPVGEPEGVRGEGWLPRGGRPVPADWRGPAHASVSPVARAGVGPLALRDPPFAARHTERDALWSALRDARSGPVAVRVEGASGLGAPALLGWLRHRVAELDCARGLDRPDAVTRDGLQLLVVDDLDAVLGAWSGWKEAGAPVCVVGRAGAGLADARVLALEPLDDLALRDLAAAWIALHPDALDELVALAEGWPGVAVALVREAIARLESTPWGLRPVGGWRMPVARWSGAWGERSLAELEALAEDAFRADGPRHPGERAALIAALPAPLRRRAASRAARTPGMSLGRQLALRLIGEPDPTLPDDLLRSLGEGFERSPHDPWNRAVLRWLEAEPGALSLEAHGLRAYDPRAGRLAFYRAMQATRDARAREEVERWLDRAAEGGVDPATIAWVRAAVATRVDPLDEVEVHLRAAIESTGPARLRALAHARRGAARLRSGSGEDDFAAAEALGLDAGAIGRWRASGLAAAGRVQDALDTIDALEPGERSALVTRDQRSLLLYRLGRFHEAIDELEAALTAPDAAAIRPQLVENLAWCLARLDRFDEALARTRSLWVRPGPTGAALLALLRAATPDAELDNLLVRVEMAAQDVNVRNTSNRWALEAGEARARAAGLHDRAAAIARTRRAQRA